jgi:hypothetical protein
VNPTRTWLIATGIALVALFLLFFFYRYQYVQNGMSVTRVDRLTGAQCVMPCLAPTPGPTSPAQDLQAQRAIAIVRARTDAMALVYSHSSGDYEWSGFPESSVRQTGHGGSPDTYLVCYCEQTEGWRWEVHLGTGEVYYVNDNANLSAKYGVSRSTPVPSAPAAPLETAGPITQSPHVPGTSPLTPANVLALLRATSQISVTTRENRTYVTVFDDPANGTVDPYNLWSGRMADGRWVGIVPLDSGGPSGIKYTLMWVWTEGRAQFIGEVPAENSGLGHLEMSVVDGVILLQWPLYKTGDARCCPSLLRKKRLTLDGIRLRPLNDVIVSK